MRRLGPRRRVLAVPVVLALLTPAAVATAGADTYPRQPGVDVLEYVFRLRLADDTDSVVGLTTVDVRFREHGVDSLELDLVGPTTEGAGMTVSGVWVAGVDARDAVTAAAIAEADRGTTVEFAHQGDRLRIPLPAPGERDGRAFVTVAYAGVPAGGLRIGPNMHGDRTFFSDNWPSRARHWLPTVDHVYDKARSQMVVTAPGHYQVVSNGLLVEETDLEDGTRRTWWRQSVPIAPWLYVLGVAEFAVQHLAPFEGKPVQTWVYPQDRDAGFAVFDDPTHAALRFYSDWVGPFAYEKLANVQSASVGGGMEAATAIFYGEESVTGGTRWRDVIIHEIAHQWFGNAVTESDWDDVWLSEGFATYFTSLFVEHAYGHEEFVQRMIDARQRVFDFYAERPDYRIVHDELDDMSRVTTGMQYQKGAWVLHMLRRLVGEEPFWRGIREYYDRHFNGHATTADFRRAMEEASGQELGWFLDQWLTRGGLPELRVTWEHDGPSLWARVEQTQPGPPFRLPVEIVARLADGSEERATAWIDGDGASVRMDMPVAPERVVVDPDTWLLARISVSAVDR